MTDDQQRARELLAAEYTRLGWPSLWARMTLSGEIGDFDKEPQLAAITAALRAAPESVALRTAMMTLEQIATAPDDKGAKLNAASCVAFLTTQGAVGTIK